MNHDQSGQLPELPEGLPEDQSAGHTLREIADAIGVDKSTVFRYVQRCGIAPIDATQRCKRFDATAENAIVEHFATMRNDPTTMRGRLAMMRNSSGNDAGNDAQGLQRCSATTPDSSPELDAIRAELDQVTADRETLIQQLNQMRGEITGHAAEVKRLLDQLDQLRQDHRQELDRIQAGHAAELDRMQEAHRQQLDDLRAQLEEVKRDLTEERQHSRAQSDTLAQLADQAQRLQLAQMQPPAALPEEITPQNKPTLWQRIFGKKK